MFLGWPFSKIVREILIRQKHVALVNGGFLHYTEMKEFFKNLLLWNRWSDFEIISQICSLGDPFQKLFAKFWSVKNMALVNGGFLHYTEMKEFLKISSSLKLLARFWNNFTGDVPWVTLFKNCSRNFDFVKKHGSGEWGLLALYGNEEILKNSSSSETAGQILK